MDMILHFANCHGEWTVFTQVVLTACECLPFLNGTIQSFRLRLLHQHAHHQGQECPVH